MPKKHMQIRGFQLERILPMQHNGQNMIVAEKVGTTQAAGKLTNQSEYRGAS